MPRLSVWCALGAALVVGCNGQFDVGAPGATPQAPPGPNYQAVPAWVAAGKVKNLLTGLPPTDAEIAAVTADPSALKGLVATWIATPQYTAKLQNFFGNAFQQTQVVSADLLDQLGQNAVGRVDARLLANLRESFARTAVELVAEGRPFTETMTTQRFMLTPRLMALYAYLDALQVSDAGGSIDLFARAHPGFKYSLTAARVIPLEQSLDPASSDYMVFYAPQLAKAYDPLCPQDPIVYDGSKGQQSISQGLIQLFLSGPTAFNLYAPNGTFHRCAPPAFPPGMAPLTLADSQQWQMVNIRQPQAGESTTPLFALASFRAGADLVLKTPRVGFFTTPSFLAEWNTNNSNQARVTANQTLIVALGRGMSPANASLPPSVAAVDQQHAPTGSDCFACHQSLDPMRQYFRQQYSLYFHPQSSSSESSLPGSFGFRGVSLAGATIFDLASQLASHPDFASAWTQKLCTYANSMPCLSTDPEFLRISTAFANSNFNFGTLVTELFSSPLVSYLGDSATVEKSGENFPVARRGHLCATLSSRLGLADVCGLDINTKVPKQLLPVQLIATVLPSDQYSRGAEEPVLANDPTLFFRTGMENVCVALAGQLIDAGSSSRWTSSSPQPAIADFVHLLMGVGAPRDATPLSILTDHFNAARAGQGDSTALKSTFTLACLTPSVVGIGQ